MKGLMPVINEPKPKAPYKYGQDLGDKVEIAAAIFTLLTAPLAFGGLHEVMKSAPPSQENTSELKAPPIKLSE